MTSESIRAQIGDIDPKSDSTDFWKLIEKIFLAENARQRHHALISAQCASRAPHGPQGAETRCKNKHETGRFRKTGNAHHKVVTNQKQEKFLDTEIRKRLERKYSKPHSSHSECGIGDNYIEYISTENSPDKLWRFVSKNRKKDLNASQLPGIKTNEAIYRALTDKSNPQCHRKTEGQKKESKLNKTVTRKQDKTKRICNSMTAMGRSKFNLKSSASGFLLPKATKEGEPRHREHEISNCKEIYDGVLRQRLHCGCKLESLNKSMIRNGNSKSTVNNETTKKYNEVKNEYLRLCYQESQLRHQIAILNAEIYMMHSKKYHKSPVSLKTITMDSKAAQLPSDGDHGLPAENDMQLFAPFKVRRNQTHNLRSPCCAHDETADQCQSVGEQDEEDFKGLKVTNLKNWKNPLGICSLYDLAPDLPKPQRPPAHLLTRTGQEDGDSPRYHRLPKLKAPPPSAVPSNHGS